MSDNEVLEGFLCPICHQDQSSGPQLIVHFEDEHSSESDVLQSLKGFYNKVKKKLNNDDIFVDESSTSSSSSSGKVSKKHAQYYETNNSWNWEPPPPGPFRNHSFIFKKIRSAWIDSYVAETNKLLIRLDKLLKDIPADPVKRKAHEKGIVQWADDKCVPLCPFCARSFNIARRRHHCRLCGGIMCEDCSQFLSFSYAKKLISPLKQRSSHNEVAVTEQSSSFGGMNSLFAGITGLKRSGSHGSLNSLLSVMDSMTGEQHFRICNHCFSRLKTRDNQVELRKSRPILSMYYDKVIEYRHELEKLVPHYNQMANSLNGGETTYQLKDAEIIRMKILKLADNLKVMAQKVKTLGAAGVGATAERSEEGEQAPAGPKQEILQKRIHASVTNYLKENVIGLPELPSPEEFIQSQEIRRKQIEARLQEEREASRQAEARAQEILNKRAKEQENSSPRPISKRLSHSPVHHSSIPKHTPNSVRKKQTEEVTVDTGWGGDSSAHDVIETDDPMVQQMNIIRNYIQQAKISERFDEVRALEENLKMLQEEYRKQHRSGDS